MFPAIHDPCPGSRSKGAAPSPEPLPAAAAHRALGAMRPRAAVQPAIPAPTARVLAFPGARTSPSQVALRSAGTPPRRTWPVPRPDAASCGTAETGKCLTTADRIALLTWTSRGSGGFARVVLEDGAPGSTPDLGSYVLLYRPQDLWATLGLTRRVVGILVWRCADGAALSEHPTMAEALAALPLLRPPPF